MWVLAGGLRKVASGAHSENILWARSHVQDPVRVLSGRAFSAVATASAAASSGEIYRSRIAYRVEKGLIIPEQLSLMKLVDHSS